MPASTPRTATRQVSAPTLATAPPQPCSTFCGARYGPSACRSTKVERPPGAAAQYSSPRLTQTAYSPKQHGAAARARARQTDGFALDLQYVHDRIIVMGFPADQALPTFASNPIGEVARFLETYGRGRAPGHSRVHVPRTDAHAPMSAPASNRPPPRRTTHHTHECRSPYARHPMGPAGATRTTTRSTTCAQVRQAATARTASEGTSSALPCRRPDRTFRCVAAGWPERRWQRRWLTRLWGGKGIPASASVGARADGPDLLARHGRLAGRASGKRRRHPCQGRLCALCGHGVCVDADCGRGQDVGASVAALQRQGPPRVPPPPPRGASRFLAMAPRTDSA